MVDHNQTLSVLKEAREILAQRMSEMILENPEEFLKDAAGDSYMDEIGTIYEKVGGRLAQINAMLGNVPSASGPVALTDSGPSAEEAPATFQAFAQKVVNGDLEAASPVLSSLLAINAESATRCTEIYSKRLADHPQTLERTMQMRVEIANGNDSAVVMILLECFALSGREAFDTLQHLKQRFAA
ncbi:MAG: hypothetical protein ACI9F9_003466 [Candidatus Paceibacteria bacterium]|jgi:hypothetical protein